MFVLRVRAGLIPSLVLALVLPAISRPAWAQVQSVDGLWSSLATVQRDGSGQVAYDDHTVTPGGRYAYLVAVSSHLDL